MRPIQGVLEWRFINWANVSLGDTHPFEPLEYRDHIPSSFKTTDYRSHLVMERDGNWTSHRTVLQSSRDMSAVIAKAPVWRPPVDVCLSLKVDHPDKGIVLDPHGGKCIFEARLLDSTASNVVNVSQLVSLCPRPNHFEKVHSISSAASNAFSRSVAQSPRLLHTGTYNKRLHAVQEWIRSSIGTAPSSYTNFRAGATLTDGAFVVMTEDGTWTTAEEWEPAEDVGVLCFF